MKLPVAEFTALLAELEVRKAEVNSVKAQTAKLVARAKQLRALAYWVSAWPRLDPSDVVDADVLSTSPSGRRAKAIRTVEGGFRWIGYLLPERIRNEEIGDALEDIHRIINDPACPNVYRAVRWKIISTWFWLFWHAVGRISAAILGKRTG